MGQPFPTQPDDFFVVNISHLEGFCEFAAHVTERLETDPFRSSFKFNDVSRMVLKSPSQNPDDFELKISEAIGEYFGRSVNFIASAVLKYREGSYCSPHVDKLSMFQKLDMGVVHFGAITILSKSEGGEFMIEDQVLDLKLGDVIVFNHYVSRHGVNPVKSGTRISHLSFLDGWKY